MRSCCVLVMLPLLGALESASARPDFGLNGDIPGSVQAADAISRASALLYFVDDYTFSLDAAFPLLASLGDALSFIAGALAGAGVAMANSFALLVEDDSGIVAPAFDDAFGAIGDMLTLLSSGFTEQFQVLQHREKAYITDMLSNNFEYFIETLSNLNTVLGTLKTAAEEAQANAGGDELPVSVALVRGSISARLMNSLLNTVVQLPGAILPLLYSMDSSLANVDEADNYILRTKGSTEGYLLQAHQAVVQFNGNLRQLETDTVAVITDVDASYQEQQELIDEVVPELQAASTFQQDLAGALASFQLTVSAGSIEEKTALLEDKVAAYISLAKTFDDDLVTVYGDRIWPALVSVVEVLVAGGPYAPYCYHKYSSKVLDLAAHNYFDLTECYELELNRVYALHRLIADIVDMVAFNYDELYDNIVVCLDAQPCPGDACDACVATLGEVLVTLARLADEKFDLILQIVPYELDASLQRLKSCAAFSKYKLIADAHDLIGDVLDCEENGYHST